MNPSTIRNDTLVPARFANRGVTERYNGFKSARNVGITLIQVQWANPLLPFRSSFRTIRDAVFVSSLQLVIGVYSLGMLVLGVLVRLEYRRWRGRGRHLDL